VEAAMAADREHSPAYLVLRASARRVLAFIGIEVERQGGTPGDDLERSA